MSTQKEKKAVSKLHLRRGKVKKEIKKRKGKEEK